MAHHYNYGCLFKGIQKIFGEMVFEHNLIFIINNQGHFYCTSEVCFTESHSIRSKKSSWKCWLKFHCRTKKAPRMPSVLHLGSHGSFFGGRDDLGPARRGPAGPQALTPRGIIQPHPEKTCEIVTGTKIK